MLTSKEVIKLIENQANKITSDIIKDLIKDHKPIKENAELMFKVYSGEPEILDRKFDNPLKVNNTINNDYAGDIVDGIVGYMFGEEISYNVDKNKYSDAEVKKYNEHIKVFKQRNSIADLDSSTGEMMSICGYAARLLYIDKDGVERAMDIKPWEAIFVMDSTIDEVKYGMIYYPVTLKENGEVVKRTKVEWYDEKKVYYFISDKDGNYAPDDSSGVTEQDHMFKYVPLIKFPNNNLEQGDFYKVLNAINAYDRTLSDIQNEVEEFRLAYFAYYGAEPDEETLLEAKRTGALYFPADTDGKFLTKDLGSAVEFMKDHKKTLNDNIYKFSKSVDMRDEQFSGSAMSGESRKWKLVNFENRAITKERKFAKALQYQFKVLCSAWNLKEIKLKYEDVEFVFKRNLPIDLKYEAEASRALKGNVTEKTRLSQLSIVTDVDDEIEEMKNENELDLEKLAVLQQKIGGGQTA